MARTGRARRVCGSEQPPFVAVDVVLTLNWDSQHDWFLCCLPFQATSLKDGTLIHYFFGLRLQKLGLQKLGNAAGEFVFMTGAQALNGLVFGNQ